MGRLNELAKQLRTIASEVDVLVSPTTPPVVVPPPVVTPPAGRTSLLDSYPSAAALLADAEALKWNTAITVDAVTVRQGFGPPERFVTVFGGGVRRT